ncbi:MAG: hypothetical protein WAV18_07405 [Roseiarcus sp.]
MTINAVTVTINSDTTVYKLSLVQDGDVFTTIHATLNGTAHDITDATASGEGTQVKGLTKWWFVEELSVNMMVSGTSATLIIAQYQNFTGTIGAADSAALIAFVKACALPPISS